MGELSEDSISTSNENGLLGYGKMKCEMDDALVLAGCTKELGPRSLLTEKTVVARWNMSYDSGINQRAA